ncbi:MAG: O-antigen ligase family protein [Planctomycetes bacterium]|nr:O-antigen ligase family protein [Planctomycetota bacterium]
MNTKLSILCDKFIEAGWLAALILTPLYMNIYSHRMFEPDKATIVRCLALLMLAFYITKIVDTLITRYRSPETAPSQSGNNVFAHFIKTPLFIGFGLFVLAYIVSVIFSAVPYNSLWGGYDRMQGLYTSAGYWVIFLMIALNLRTRAQIDRIVTTIIFTSIPIVVYAFIQKFGMDVIPWQAMDPSIRVSATSGNPHFLATYLIMIIPLTLYRTIYSAGDEWLFPLPLILYGVLALLQIIIVFLTKSYSAIVVLFLGVSIFFIIYGLYYRKISAIIISIIIFISGIIYVTFFFIPKIITIEDLPKGIGAISTRPYTSARTNVVMWRGAWKLITDKDVPYRFFIGYGPESLSTVFYKNYTMELATLEGSNVHADRAHSFYLDVWVWHGIIGFVLYLFILGSLLYLGFKTIRLKTPPNQNAPPDNIVINMLAIGFISALITHMMESLVNIPTTQSFTYFWVFAAVIYGLFRLKSSPQTEEITPPDTTEEPAKDETPALVTIYSTHDPAEISVVRLKLQDSGIPFVIQNENTQNMLPGVDGFVQAQIQVLSNDVDNAKLLLQGIVKDAGQITSPNILNIPNTFNWRLYLFIGYAVLTIAIAFILFYFTWPAGIFTPHIKSIRDTMLAIFCLWLLAGIITGIIAWPRWLFWTYAEQTILLAVIMVRRYWPDDSTNTDLLMIYSWAWFLLGLIIGALSLRDNRKPIKWGNPEGVMAGIITVAAALFIIITVNLPVLRADGFYKFCFSYDQSAEESVRQGKKDEAYQIRLMCIRHFQNALKFAPDERAYLNGSGRNFLELAKLALDQNANAPHKLRNVPSVKELVESDFLKRGADNRLYTDYNYHDFAICSFSCIQRAYELDPNNYERLIALIRIYRYLGDMERDIVKIEKALKLCDEARQASPQNDKTEDEIRELRLRLK